MILEVMGKKSGSKLNIFLADVHPESFYLIFTIEIFLEVSGGISEKAITNRILLCC